MKKIDNIKILYMVIVKEINRKMCQKLNITK